jgi:hypothetical protein
MSVPSGLTRSRSARRGLAAAAVTAVGTLIAGCGVAGAPLQVAVQRPSAQPGTQRQAPWPPGGSPAVARAVGKRMLNRLVLPPGSRRISARRQPRRAEVVGSDSLVDLHEFFSIPLHLLAAATFVNRHTPAGLRPNGPDLSTTSSRNGAITYQFVAFYLRSAPIGITDESMLLVTFTHGPHGSTVARADAEVVWYPPRTAAEYIRPGTIGSARITASFLNPKPRRFSRVITSRHAIATLAALLNGLRATDNSARFCPAIDATYHVIFIGKGGRPRVAVGATGCGLDDVAVNGKAQPPLWDPDRLIYALHKLLGLSKRYH